MNKFADAIANIESRSDGGYRAVGPSTHGGDRALGRYQVMSSNVGPWSREILGHEISPQEFMANTQLQDQIFEGKFGQYVNKYGPGGAARAWFAGEGGMNDLGRRDVLGTSVADYSRKFGHEMGFGGNTANTVGPYNPTTPTNQSNPDDSLGSALALLAPENSSNMEPLTPRQNSAQTGPFEGVEAEEPDVSVFQPRTTRRLGQKPRRA